jgi:hypothetical protein
VVDEVENESEGGAGVIRGERGWSLLIPISDEISVSVSPLSPALSRPEKVHYSIDHYFK